jgi:NADPH:quinone reductase-like Zn-dependent oxidoreductase
LAKAIGCHVTVTCSSRNAELCKTLGADEIVDYTKGDIIDSLKKLPYKFNHIVDGVGSDKRLFWKCDQFTVPGAKLVYIAFAPSDIPFVAQAKILPTFLGGQSRELVVMFAELKAESLEKVVNWVHEGKIKAVIDSQHRFGDVPEAIRKVKTGRARGKVVVKVAE